MRQLSEDEIKDLRSLLPMSQTEREAERLEGRSPVQMGAPLPLIHQVLHQ